MEPMEPKQARLTIPFPDSRVLELKVTTQILAICLSMVSWQETQRSTLDGLIYYTHVTFGRIKIW